MYVYGSGSRYPYCDGRGGYAIDARASVYECMGQAHDTLTVTFVSAARPVVGSPEASRASGTGSFGPTVRVRVRGRVGV